VIDDSFWNEKKLSIIIISVLFLVSLIYFANFLTTRKMIYGSDWLLSGYTNHQSWVSYIKLHKRLPMWDGYNFSGNPIMASRGGGGMVYPLDIFYFIFPVHFGWTVMYIIHTFLAGLGMWLLLKEYKLSSLSSLIGAVSFMFAGQLITTTQGGHLGRMIAAVVLPFAFLFLHRALRTKKLSDFIIFGGITGLFLLAGHTQISYWGMIGIVLYFIYEVIRRKNELGGKGICRMGLVFGIGIVVLLLIVSIKLLPPALSLGYGARGATRGYQYATSWSLPTSELSNLIAPHFSGILGNYWGENYFKLDSRYLGILPLILFGFAFFYREKKHLIKYFAWFTCITLILALGKNTPLFKIYYYLVPMAKKFRGPSMFFFLTTFGVAVLSGFGAESLIQAGKENDKEKKKRMMVYLFIFVALVLLCALIVNIGNQGILKAMSSHFIRSHAGILNGNTIQHKISLMAKNFGNFKKSLMLTVLLLLVNGGLILGVIKGKLSYNIVIPVLILILLIDQWSVDKKYLSSAASPERYFEPDDVARFISQDKGVFRVYPLSYEKGKGGYLHYNNIENVGGYGPNPPKRYQEFIGAGSGVIFQAPNFFRFPYLLSMLNVKYIIAPRLPEDLSRYPEETRTLIEEYKNFYSNFELAGKGERYEVLRNNNFLPRASLVYEYSVANSGAEVLDRVLSPTFKPGNVVVLEENSEEKLRQGEGFISVKEYQANERVFETVTEKESFFILRENYHPHWECYIDGKREKVYKANYIFYGVFVPEGKHTISFVYESSAFNLVAAMSFAGFLLFLVALVFPFKEPFATETPQYGQYLPTGQAKNTE